MKNNIKSKVMTIANSLVKQGISRSAAMIRAWITVELHTIRTKAAGVTFGRRQGLLDRLNKYSPEDITITLQRESGNAYDPNAVQIVAGVKGKGSAVMGYVGRELAKVISPLLDKGKAVKADFAGITGGHEYGLNYGLNVAISL
ncbi:MAG: HIRAN domain-containing protein [Ruminiclostridium sp.]|uniref:HIRAN domain-containing protein n=1 Tax=Ruminococcus sp. TaxID=41978 RepID=UPI0025F760A9|nr:HIRAN domain-containing protein [Ruminococcus sp.]MBR1433039.1 HIRAN domain-containing protein [Ruminococcus sp.]MBR1831055.1 HIRAN domain-containing protein [Ruminiclostridium sp.]